MNFTKWEGLGNDFILMEGDAPPDAPQLAQQWCQRRTGIGADGLVYVGHGPRMVIFNRDGSRPQMCGNAIRCLAAWRYHLGRCFINQWETLQTDSGPRKVRVTRPPSAEEAAWVEVDMGPPRPIENFPPLQPIPEVGLPGHFVSMGNPHLVVLCPEGLPTRADFERWGASLTAAPFAPPEGVNVEFVARRADGLQMLVWERGVGPTEACGTGACAALVVAVRVGWVQGPTPIGLPGGDLLIDWNGSDGVLMSGPARCVFEGTITKE